MIEKQKDDLVAPTAKTSATITSTDTLAALLTIDEVGAFLRKSRKAIYAMIERAQLPGVVRIGRRLFGEEAFAARLRRPQNLHAVATGVPAMSVKVRPYRSGGWEVDITFRLPNGHKHRERSKAPVELQDWCIAMGSGSRAASAAARSGKAPKGGSHT